MNLLFTLLLLLFGMGQKTPNDNNSEGLNSSDKKVKSEVEVWVTSPSNNVLFQKQNTILNFGKMVNQNPTITVDPNQAFQTIDGFGNCLTGGTATLLNRMDNAGYSLHSSVKVLHGSI